MSQFLNSSNPDISESANYDCDHPYNQSFNLNQSLDNSSQLQYSHGQPNAAPLISQEQLVEIFNFDGTIFRLKKGVHFFFLVLIGKKAGVAKILRSFSKLCVPLLGIKGPKFIIFGQFCK